MGDFAGESEKAEFNELPHILSRGGAMGKEELWASALCDFAEIGAVQEQAVGTTLCQRVCHTNTNSSL